MALRAVLLEFYGRDERDRRPVFLEPEASPITIGRSDGCTYTIGRTFGPIGQQISKVHATIVYTEAGYILRDGGPAGPSRNGIYCHNEQIKEPITLIAGLELTLFKEDPAKVTLRVSDTGPEEESDTYTGQEVVNQLQKQLIQLKEETAALHEQVGLTVAQMKERAQIDARQDERQTKTDERLSRTLAAVFAAIAVIVVVNGWSGGSDEDKKLWASTLTGIVSAVAAVYFKQGK